jgi:hypothetical protein
VASTKNQIKNVRKRPAKKPSLNKLRLETSVLKNEFEQGMVATDRLQRQRRYLVAQIQLELEAQRKLREKIEYIKTEFHNLQKGHDTNAAILVQKRAERKKLEQEADRVEQILADKVSVQPNLTVKGDFSKLIEAINHKGRSANKEKSVLLTCLKELIKTTENNEFDDFTWNARVAGNKEGLGVRIVFESLSIGRQDLKYVYKPAIASMARKFKNYKLQIQTKTLTKSGVVKALDIVLKLPIYKEELKHARDLS